ncbi:unnamed protein product [Prunus armeniaca]|uniref:Uncharacterized protein n=1 Tax=Prunus armeniaca TaxID=36596 RepID=A0A6J5TYT1_PRUAR|nr:unnamed protein product [Prunus armeniaca]
MKAVAENIGLRSLQVGTFVYILCTRPLLGTIHLNLSDNLQGPLTAVEGAHGRPSSDLTTWKSSLCVDEEFFISNKIN